MDTDGRSIAGVRLLCVFAPLREIEFVIFLDGVTGKKSSRKGAKTQRKKFGWPSSSFGAGFHRQACEIDSRIADSCGLKGSFPAATFDARAAVQVVPRVHAR